MELDGDKGVKVMVTSCQESEHGEQQTPYTWIFFPLTVSLLLQSGVPAPSCGPAMCLATDTPVLSSCLYGTLLSWLFADVALKVDSYTKTLFTFATCVADLLEVLKTHGRLVPKQTQ